MMNKAVIISLVAVAIVMFIAGFLLGTYQSVKWLLSKAKYFMSVEFDEKQVAHALWAYKTQVDKCYPSDLNLTNLKGG